MARERNDDLCVAALAAGKTWKEAAVYAGIHEATVAQRMRDPNFRRRVSEAREQIIVAGYSDLVQSLGAATKVLRDVAENLKEKTSDRVRASAHILEYTLRYRNETDLAERVRLLEETRDELAGKGPSDREAAPTGETSQPDQVSAEGGPEPVSE